MDAACGRSRPVPRVRRRALEAALGVRCAGDPGPQAVRPARRAPGREAWLLGLDVGGPIGREDESTFSVDVVDGWSRLWNLKSDRSVGGAPASSLWVSDPAGFGQVGCVYTAQGFEYPWNGVILGRDLVWLVRNVYRVLLTRRLVGTLLYTVDAEPQAMLRGVINPR